MRAALEIQSDEQLIHGVAGGDHNCLGLLFERHHVELFQYCLNLTRDRALSEDLVQEVFLKLLKKAGSYRGDGTFKGWVFNIARNATFDLLQKRQRQSALDIEDETVNVQMIDHRSTEQIAAGQQNLQLTGEALAALPEAAREVIWLGRFVFENHEELGQALGCSASAARVRMHRAMQQLHETFVRLNGAPIDVG